MSIPARAPTPEAIAEARRLYEHSRVPMQAIAELLGISKSTLNLRIRDWGWKRRQGRIPLHMPAAGEAAPDAAAPAGSAAHPDAAPLPGLSPAGGRRELIARLVARIETEIARIERLLLRAGLNPGVADGSEAERAARTLGVLVRSLRELAALERGTAPDEDEEEPTRDADAYRRELAAALDRVLAGRAAE
ncbi:hypothetical protein [Ancylobacter terrae]|uniref:hypothetical protein n=1 Tax=Ancylobacter sp. sgz301288 TaxID=3342077 RepID=UPI00385945EF